MNPLAEIIGESPGIVAIRETVGRLLQRPPDARRLPPILIQGETGTGKGLLAGAMHRAGPRAAGPFVAVNCAAIPDTLLEAEMFGFERGAFTDARQAKPGLLQAAHRGTIFLDEVGLLPEGLQAKFLTAIEEQTVRRLGSTRSEAIDVWVLTATSESLLSAVRGRRFREDLYHRLSVLTLWLPPLRERGGDIALLAERLLTRACNDYGLPPKALAPDARAALLAYEWPGNIRELANVMERVALLSDAPTVTAELLALPARSPAALPEAAPRQAAMPMEDAVGGVEREYLLDALRQTDWNISRAAARLGIPRNTLRYRIEKHGLRPQDLPPASRQRATQPVEPAPSAAPAVPAAMPAGVAAGTGVSWDQRRLTLLHASLARLPGEPVSFETSRPLEVFMEKVRSFGGRVEEMSSTGIVAVFGLEPVEDSPRRAAHAAMAIQKAAERARGGGAEPPAVKLGIHTGQFMVGRVGGATQMDADAKRAAWRVLEALVEHAEPDTILVSAAAAPLLERRFDLVPAGGVEPALGAAYRLAGRERTGLGRRMARFVGRGHELELLQGRLAAALRGHGQVVGIGGEAGIGKSRLLFEFRQSLAGQRVAYLEGRCASYGSGIPYLPVLDLLRMGCRIAEIDGPATIVQKVRFGLQLLGIDPEEAAPYFLQLLGVKEGTERLAVLSPEAINVRTLEVLRQTSLKSSRRRPLILAVEDVHWIDSASDAYLAALVESLAGAPILLVVTHRPGYRPPWLEKSYATQIALQPLAPEESLDVVRSVLPPEAISDPLAQLILEKAEGNPFFLEELARVVAGQGEDSALPVPDTIQEVLLARIDRLPGELRRLLQTAAILGREVSLRLLGAVWAEPGGLLPQIQELTRLEFLYEQSGGEESVYVFTHALTREVARESLPISRRQALHAAAGRALESLYADRLPEAYARLAYHFSKAKQADKAVEYLTRLAEKAARGYAHTEAATALEEALVHAERLPPEERDRCLLDLVLRQAHSLSLLGRFSEALNILLREEARLGRLRAPALAGPYYFWLGHTYSYLGDQERAAASAQRALEEAERGGDDATLGKTHLLLAQESSWSGQPLQGIEHGRRAVELLERTGEQWWLGLAHWIVGINHVITGRFGPALEAEARACATGEAIGDPRIQSYATWTAGWIQALRGEGEAGIEACKRGLAYSLDPVNTAVASAHLGYAYLETGDLPQAVSLLEESVAQMSEFGFRRLQGRFLTFLGEAYLASGQIGKARELVTQGLQLTRDAKYWYGLGWAQLALGRIARAGGHTAEAEARLQEALESFGSVHAEFMAGRTRLALAEVAHEQGDSEAATRHLAEAYQVFRSLQVPSYEERARQLANSLGVRLVADRAD